MSKPLDCPNCGGDVPAKNVNIDRMVAVCPTCDMVFQFGGGGVAVPSPTPTSVSSPYGKRKLKQKPRKVAPSRAIRIFDDKETGGFEIHKRDRNAGRNGAMAFLIFFTLVWDGFMVAWFWIAFSTGELGMAAFGSIHGTVGVGLTYWVLSHFLNMTRIAVTQDEITVTTAPIYVHAPRRFSTEHIDQLYVKQTAYEANGNHHYEVMADVLGEGAKKLVGGFVNYTDAVYVEQEIEYYLNIEDMPISGEANPHKLYY